MQSFAKYFFWSSYVSVSRFLSLTHSIVSVATAGPARDQRLGGRHSADLGVPDHVEAAAVGHDQRHVHLVLGHAVGALGYHGQGVARRVGGGVAEPDRGLAPCQPARPQHHRLWKQETEWGDNFSLADRQNVACV